MSAAMEEETGSSGISRVRHTIIVLSGKGGVGKSTVATQIALGFRDAGKKVGILDVDLCGPSIPRMLNVEDSDIHQCLQGWVPVFADPEQRLGIMSIGFLLSNKEDPVVWRGPKKTAMIKQFIDDVFWSELDYLVIDTPPGTSDEHITVVECLRQYSPDGAILVTTPQECTNIFSKGGGESLSEMCSVPFLGRIPLDPQLAQCMEDGQSFFDLYPQSVARDAVKNIVEKMLEQDYS